MIHRKRYDQYYAQGMTPKDRTRAYTKNCCVVRIFYGRNRTMYDRLVRAKEKYLKQILDDVRVYIQQTGQLGKENEESELASRKARNTTIKEQLSIVEALDRVARMERERTAGANIQDLDSKEHKEMEKKALQTLKKAGLGRLVAIK